MRIAFWALVAVAAVSAVCAIGVHAGCSFLEETLGTSSWGFLRFANTCVFFAIALAVSPLLKGTAPEAEE